MANTDISKVRQVLRDHEVEIAAELGIPHEEATKVDLPVRNANADPSSPMAARTGRIASRSDLGIDL